MYLVGKDHFMTVSFAMKKNIVASNIISIPIHKIETKINFMIGREDGLSIRPYMNI